jgi:hypothetical protein
MPTRRRRRRMLLLSRRGGVAPVDPLLSLFSGGVGAGGREGAYWQLADLSTVFEDRAATIPASVNGLVGVVKDKSPNARHFVAVSDSGRGTLRASGGKYWIETDGVDDAYGTTVGGLTSVPEPLYMLSAHSFEGGATPTSTAMTLFRRNTSILYAGIKQAQSVAASRQFSERTAGGGPVGVNSPTSPAVGTPVVADGYLAADGTRWRGCGGRGFRDRRRLHRVDRHRRVLPEHHHSGRGSRHAASLVRRLRHSLHA